MGLNSRALRTLPAALIVCLAAAGTASADEVRIDGFWFDQVRVSGVREGELLYLRGGRQQRVDFEDVEGLRLSDHPQLAQGDEAMEAGRPGEAAGLYRQVVGRARSDWLRQYATMKRVRALDADGQGARAVLEYLRLIRLASDEPVFLGEPPVASARGLDAERREDFLGRVRSAARTVNDRAASEAIGDLIDALEGKGPAPGAATGPGGPAGGEGASAETGDWAIDVPAFLLEGREDDPIFDLLRKGAFREALDLAAEELGKENPSMSLRMYQQGVAQLGLARRNEDPDMFREAGLSFVMCRAYYPGSAYWKFGYVDLVEVLIETGQTERAERILEQAREAVLSVVDLEETPGLALRLLNLRRRIDGEAPVATLPAPEGES